MDQIPLGSNGCSDTTKDHPIHSGNSQESSVSNHMRKIIEKTFDNQDLLIPPLDQQLKEIGYNRPMDEAETEDESETGKETEIVYDILKVIDRITREAEVLRSKVENYPGSSTDDKEYAYLEEMLIRATVELDNLDVKNSNLIRQERKKAVHYIQKLMKILDAQLKENKKNIVANNRYCSSSEEDL